MAVNLERTGWVELFTQRRAPNGFLSSLFTVKPGGMYMGDKVALDIQRFGEEVAVVIKKCTAGRLNDLDVFTTKEFTPPAYSEQIVMDVCDLLNRMAGVDPFSAAYNDYAGQLVAYFVQGFALIDDKIKRAIELQASQILQTGQLNLTDSNGNILYNLDFFPKATHFPTAGTPWNAGGDPLADLEDLAKVIRADGKINPNMLIMGDTSFRAFIRDQNVQDVLDNRRMDVGRIDPRFENTGATKYGEIWIGAYRMDIWTYPDTYTDPQTGLPVTFVDADKVIMLSDQTRLDKMSARVPLPLGPDPRVSGLLPDRMFDVEEGFDVTPNVWATNDGKQIMGALESRTLLVPVQIDGFGCITTGV
jgi:hypothetical protein